MQRINFLIAGICYKLLQQIRRADNSQKSNLAVFADDDLGLRISCFGEFESEVLSFLRSAFGSQMSDSIFVDIGANLGNHTNGLSDFFSKTHAFEPDPRTFRLLTLNTAAHHNITRHQLALSDTVGSAQFMSERRNTGKSHMIAKDTHATDQSKDNTTGPTSFISEVPTEKLDNLDLGSKKIGFVKIDVEGHELAVLHGAAETLRLNKPLVMIELLTSDIHHGRAPSLDYLAELGYTKFVSIEPASLRIAAISNIPVIRWINHVIHAVQILTFGQRPATSHAIKIDRLENRNYEAILVSA